MQSWQVCLEAKAAINVIIWKIYHLTSRKNVQSKSDNELRPVPGDHLHHFNHACRKKCFNITLWLRAVGDEQSLWKTKSEGSHQASNALARLWNSCVFGLMKYKQHVFTSYIDWKHGVCCCMLCCAVKTWEIQLAIVSICRTLWDCLLANA